MKTHDKTLNKMACSMTSWNQQQLKNKDAVNESLMLTLTQLTSHVF